MKRLTLVFTLIFFLAKPLSAQVKVAVFSIGQEGTKDFEQFAFWTENGKRTSINYKYGINGKEQKLLYIGRSKINGDSCFTARFSNNFSVFIIPKGNKLRITDGKGKYDKIFQWKYEGPVNGIGTFCSICAADEAEAINLLLSAF